MPSNIKIQRAVNELLKKPPSYLLPAADLERSKDRVSIQSKSNFFAPLLYVLANKRDPTSSKQLTHRIDYMLIDREVLSPPRKASRIEGNLRKDFKAL